MTKLKSLWNIWFLGFMGVSNIYLAYSTIIKYLEYKFYTLDPAYGLNWDPNLCYIVLGPLIIALSLLPIILYFGIMYTGNLADDGQCLYENCSYFELVLTSKQQGVILPLTESVLCIKNRIVNLLYMEMPPITCLLQVIAALCYLIPIPFIEGQYILHGVIKTNRVWHTDLDQLFQPDKAYPQFTFYSHWIYEQPLSVAYINLALSLMALMIQYSRVFWPTNRLFTCLFSFLLFLVSLHILLDFSCLCIVVKLGVNAVYFSEKFHIQSSPYSFVFMFFIGSIIMLVSMTTLFHYGLLQYADAFIVRCRRQNRLPNNNGTSVKTGNLSNVGTNAALLSPCNSISDNNCATGCHNIELNEDGSPTKLVFSRSNKINMIAIFCSILVGALKFHNLYWQFKSVYDTLHDSLILTNLVLICLLALVWGLVWFALGIRKTWKFKITSHKSRPSEYTLPSTTRNQLTVLNNAHYAPNNGHYSLIPGVGAQTASLSRTPYLLNGTPLSQGGNGGYYLQPGTGNLMKASDLAMHQIQNSRATTGMDAFSDDDISSRLSSNNNNNNASNSNNYVLMQSLRQNGPHNSMVVGNFDTIQSHTGSQHSHNLGRNPIYLSYTNTTNAAANQNTMFQEDTNHNNSSHPMRSPPHIPDDSLDSEHSYNSGRTPINNSLPPLLPNFDESRYRNMNNNANIAAMDKLIPRYLRNTSSLDTGSVQIFPNDLLMMTSPTPGTLEHLQPLQQQGSTTKNIGGHRFGSPLTNGLQQHRMTHNLYEENNGEIRSSGILTPDLNLLPSLHSSQDTNLHRLSLDLHHQVSQPPLTTTNPATPLSPPTHPIKIPSTTSKTLNPTNNNGSIVSSNETNSNMSGNQSENTHQNTPSKDTPATTNNNTEPDAMTTDPANEPPSDTPVTNTDRMCSQV